MPIEIVAKRTARGTLIVNTLYIHVDGYWVGIMQSSTGVDVGLWMQLLRMDMWNSINIVIVIDTGTDIGQGSGHERALVKLITDLCGRNIEANHERNAHRRVLAGGYTVYVNGCG